MKDTRKIPFMAGASMALVMGFLCYISGVDTNTAYLRIAATMVIFYVIGIVIKNTIEGIKSEIECKSFKTKTAGNTDNESSPEIPGQEQIENEPGTDSANEAEDDGFTPLAASNHINSMREDK